MGENNTVWSEIVPSRYVGYEIHYGRGTRLFALIDWRWTHKRAVTFAKRRTEVLQAMVNDSAGSLNEVRDAQE